MGKIVALGGGELRLNETMLIDKFIVEFADVSKPKLLFIPTASNDSRGYIEIIKKIYGEQLKCEIDTLLLVNNNTTEYEIQQKILSSDIIYVGGGDTTKMMEVWRNNEVDKYLREAYVKNIVLSGISAGSICWFSKGHGDSNIKTNPEGWWDYSRTTGIGLIPAIHCPHYNLEGHKSFDNAMKSQQISGIALEDNCAIVIKDDMYKIIKSNENSKAYLLKNDNGIVNKRELNAFDFSPLSDIL